ncbi:tyrosine-type recombinase/integrase [Halobacterium yunchengense]|uniref:tyrosine-type recombinase/integrase n=1 Tax=Halobacterium yunchengense TaxID=3108497 RepID=UPI00300BEC84
MGDYANSQVRAKVWVTPDEVESLRSACYATGAEYLQQRNEAIVTTMYDTGLRVGELVQVDIELLRNNNSELYLPTELQKDYPNESSPPPVTLELAGDTTRLLSAYLTNRWKDTPSLFPSRSSERISEQGVRNMLHKIAEEAGIRPYKLDGSRGDPSDVTPHALRHGVAYRMMNEEDGNTLYDVRNRLRHRSIQTTERVYDHLLKV